MVEGGGGGVAVRLGCDLWKGQWGFSWGWERGSAGGFVLRGSSRSRILVC